MITPCRRKRKSDDPTIDDALSEFAKELESMNEVGDISKGIVEKAASEEAKLDHGRYKKFKGIWKSLT